MDINPAVTSDDAWQFLMALNESPMFIPAGLTELKLVPAPPPLNYSWRPKDKALDQEARQAYVAHLRYLADEWIKTGRRGDVESPLERMLKGNLRRTLSAWAAENRPDITFDVSGRTVLRMPVTRIDYNSPVAAAENAAVLLFRGFLDSPFRYRLFKCRRCNAYYYTERQPRGSIKYGTYCPLHRHAASANRSNEKRRAPEHEQKLDLAARCWNRWQKDMTDEGRRAEWVATTVNRKLDRNCTEIKRNWVTRHKSEIEKRSRLFGAAT